MPLGFPLRINMHAYIVIYIFMHLSRLFSYLKLSIRVVSLCWRMELFGNDAHLCYIGVVVYISNSLVQLN